MFPGLFPLHFPCARSSFTSDSFSHYIYSRSCTIPSDQPVGSGDGGNIVS